VLAAYTAVAVACGFFVQSFCIDEGFYMLAARNVLEGQVPYRDFVYPQMPLLPFVYASWAACFGPSVESGRALSLILGVTAVTLTMAAGRRLGGVRAGAFAGLLMLVSTYTCLDLAWVKTQALSHAFAAAAAWSLARRYEKPQFADDAAALAALSLATLTRLSYLAPLAVLAGWVAWRHRTRPRAAVLLLACTAAILALGAAMFWADGRMLFNVFTLHREFVNYNPWSWKRLAWTAKGTIGNQFMIVSLFVVGLLQLVIGRGGLPPGRRSLATMLAGGVIAMTLLHWSQAESYPSHQTPMTAMMLVFIVASLWPAIDRAWSAAPWLVLAGFGTVSLMATPFSEFNLLQGAFSNEGGLARTQAAVALLKRHVPAGGIVLTFHDELCVNGGYKAVSGCDASQFSYAPFLDDDEAARLHMLTFNGLVRAIDAEDTAAVVISDRDVAIMCAAREDLAALLVRKLSAQYASVGTVHGYGQYRNEIKVLRRIRQQGGPEPGNGVPP